MAIHFKFTNRNTNEEGIRVYRSNVAFTLSSLPPVHATLASGVTEWTDEAVMRGDRFFYRFEVFRGEDSAFSVLVEAWALPTLTGPGPQTLIAGDHRGGFYGEVPVSELVSGDDLATLVGLTTGTAQFSGEPWLKFNLHGKTLFIAKKPYRHSISWDQLHAQGLVFGETTVEVFGDTYKCRLLTGGDANPARVAGGEWNDLLYPIHVDDPEGRAWAQYTDADLLTHSNHGNGGFSWCQETSTASAINRCIRGDSGVLGFSYVSSPASDARFGWRPCLELV